MAEFDKIGMVAWEVWFDRFMLSKMMRYDFSFFLIVCETWMRQVETAFIFLPNISWYTLKQIFPEEYRGLSPNFHIHASVSDLYIPTISLPFLL